MREERVFYVYEWFKIETDEVFYIGKGSNDRYKNIRGRNKYFKRIYNKYKCDVRIICNNLTEEEAYDLEIQTIKKYRECGCELTNLSEGGKGGSSGVIRDEEYREKFRGVNNPMYGRPWWNENTPQYLIEEWRSKLGFKGEKNPAYGKPFHDRMSEETYKRWLKAHREKVLGEKNGRAKKCLMLDSNKEVIKEFNCIKDCTDYLIENNIVNTTKYETVRSYVRASSSKNKLYCNYYFKII